MKKIITAINNPKLNEELKKEKKFEVIGKDIQYKEAILEILEQEKDIELLIISEEIPGEITFEKLIEKIKNRKEEIKIIFILEKENIDLEKILIKNNIRDIYYNNKINLGELIKIINKKEINVEEEIIKLKKIIEEKNINIEKKELKEKNKLNKKLEIIKKEIKDKINSKKNVVKIKPNSSNMLTKIITFSGNYKSGKTSLSLIISQRLSEKSYKVLVIDGDLEKNDLTTILKKEIEKKIKRKKFHKNKIKKRKLQIFKNINRVNLKNRKNKIYNYKILKLIKNNTTLINNNLYFFSGLKELLKNRKEKKIKNIINKFFKLLKQKYDFILIDLNKTNKKEISKELLEKSNTNFIVLEPNLLGIKEIEQLLNLYILEWKINKNSLHIIKNKKSFISVNRKLISKYLSFKNKIFEIGENNFFYFLTNHYFRKKIFLKNKIIKKEIDKIINKIACETKYQNN